MDSTQIANVLGFVATGIGVVMFIPQAYRVYKTKNTKSISLLTFLLSIGTSTCWIIYALIMSANSNFICKFCGDCTKPLHRRNEIKIQITYLNAPKSSGRVKLAPNALFTK